MADELFDERLARQRDRLDALEAVVTAVAALDADVAGRLGPVVDDGVRRSRAMLEEVAAGSWASLDDCSRQVTEIVGLLLQLISGALVRAVDLDDGMCRIADRLLAEVSAAAVQPLWGALTIPSHAELFDLRDGCIRVGWGNRQLWGVPLVLHELGHAAGARVSRLTEVNGRLTVEHPLLERANAIGEGLDVKYLHLQEHWADIFAVFVGGLAPLAAMASLVFPPSRADRATGTHPSPARRVAAMAEALRRLHPRDQQVELALRWLDATWRRIVADATIVEPGPDVATIVEQCVDDLQTSVPGAQCSGFGAAFVLLQRLRTGHPPEVGYGADRMIDVMNAAWLGRLSPDRTLSVDVLARRAMSMARELAHG